MAAVATATTAVAPAEAAPRADLGVKRLSEPPAQVAPGGSLRVKDAVRNRGRRRAGRFVVVYWLSSDRRRGRGDIRIGSRRQKGLRGRRTAKGRRSLKLPLTLAPGSYHLIACADGTRKVRERKERNNCRSSRRRVAVVLPVVPGAPAIPAAPAPAPPPAAPAPPAHEPEPPAGVPSFPLPADPLTVSHVKQTGNARTQTITVGGGKITATADDGTKYTLDIPFGALVSDEQITMTPISAVEGSPLSGGLVGAVELLPHGLELLKTATLTIEPAGDAGDVAGQTGFLSHEGGEDFHLYPLSAGGGLQMQLTHFSTPGIAQATDADRQAVLAHPPERHRAQYEQMMEDVIRESRVAQEANPDTPMPADQIAAILRGYYNDIVWPLVEQAYTDDTKATQALSELLSWARQVQLLSLEQHEALKVRHDAVWDNVKAILENAIHDGYDRCVTGHDLDFIVRLLGLSRIAALLGLQLGDEAYDKAQRCANFEVLFDSRITQDHAIEGGTQDHQTNAVWHVEVDRLPIDITGIGTGAMTWKAFSYLQTSTYHCSEPGKLLTYEQKGTGTKPDDSITMLLGMDLNPREPGTPPPADRDIQLRMYQYQDVGETYQTTATTWCGDAPPDPTTDEASRWRGHYDYFHLDEFLTGFRNWTMGAGDLIATKSYSRSGQSGLSELTTVELWHTPLG